MFLEVNWEGPLDLTQSEIEKIPADITGVYVIWAYNREQMVYVGSGNIQECLLRHIQNEKDPVVQAKIPNLKAGYATICDEENYKGAENYLAYLYKPEIGANYPDKTPREIIPAPLHSIKNRISFDGYITDSCWQSYKIDFMKWAQEQHGPVYKYPQKGRRIN